MTAEERQAWLADYQTFLVDFPKVENLKTLTASLRETVEQGLTLLDAFVYCHSFVAESRRVKDYHRRLKTLRRFIDRVTADIQKELKQTIDLTDPALLVPHVGRPTKEEAAARTIAKQKEIEEQQNAPNLFNQADNADDAPSDGSAVGLMAAYPAPTKYQSVAEIKWLLSPALQEKADTIRDLRASFEDNSTRAKQMAEDGRDADDIAPIAQQAAKDLEAFEKIYADIDAELQTVYVWLNEDTAYIEEIAKISRLDNKELRTVLRPYWDKLSPEDKELFKARVIEQIKANDPEQAAIREEIEAKKKAVNDIRKYLQRTDKPNTLVRLKGMEEKLADLRNLIGDEADKYMPLLEAAKVDYETNIKPAEDAKRAERAREKAEKDAARKAEREAEKAAKKTAKSNKS